MVKTSRKNKVSRKNVSRKNKKSKKNGKQYSRKTKINKMKGGVYNINDPNNFPYNCAICIGDFIWSDKFGIKPKDFPIPVQDIVKDIPVPVLLDDDKVGQLWCGHIFHKKCIEDWFNSGIDRNKCPNCNKIFTLNDILNVGEHTVYDENFFIDLFKERSIFNLLNILDARPYLFEFRNNKRTQIGLYTYDDIIDSVIKALTSINNEYTENPNFFRLPTKLDFEFSSDEYNKEFKNLETKLIELDLSFINNKSSPDLSPKLFKKLVICIKDILEKNKIKIKNLLFSYNDFNLENFILISIALKKNETLTELDISNCNINNAGAKFLGEALKINKSLLYLNISNNDIGHEGAEAIAEALKFNSTLTHLYISNNKIGNIGATALAEALKFNSTLTHLYISNNKIGDIGAITIAEMLGINKTLENLSINLNIITKMGIKSLAIGLGKNLNTISFVMDGNDIDKETAILLGTELKKRENLNDKKYLIGKKNYEVAIRFYKNNNVNDDIKKILDSKNFKNTKIYIQYD